MERQYVLNIAYYIKNRCEMEHSIVPSVDNCIYLLYFVKLWFKIINFVDIFEENFRFEKGELIILGLNKDDIYNQLNNIDIDVSDIDVKLLNYVIDTYAKLSEEQLLIRIISDVFEDDKLSKDVTINFDKIALKIREASIIS